MRICFCILPQYGEIFLPHLGLACIISNLKENLPEVKVNVLDARLYNYYLTSPNDMFYVSNRYCFSLELPTLAEIITIKKMVDKYGSLNKKIIADIVTDELILKIAELKMIRPEFFIEYFYKAFELIENLADSVFSYDIIGFTVYQTNILMAVLFSLYLKNITRDPPLIVFGGPQMTLSLKTAELLLRLGIIDVAVIGEGEATFLDLVRNFEKNQEYCVDGCMMMENGKITFSPRKLIENLDKLPCPDFSEFELEKYPWSGFVLPIYASRGCPYRCSFCSEWKLWKRFRVRSVDRVLEDIVTLQNKYGTILFYFTDSLLNFYGGKWILEFAKKLIENNIFVKWGGFFRANMNARDIKLLKKAGLIGVSIGVESFSDQVLNNMRKLTDYNINYNAIESFIKNRLYTEVNIISAFPGESKKDFLITYNKCKEMLLKYSDFVRIKHRNFELRAGSLIHLKPNKYLLEVSTWQDVLKDQPYGIRDIVNSIILSYKYDVSTEEIFRRRIMFSNLVKMYQEKNKKAIDFIDLNFFRTYFVKNKHRILVKLRNDIIYSYDDEFKIILPRGGSIRINDKIIWLIRNITTKEYKSLDRLIYNFSEFFKLSNEDSYEEVITFIYRLFINDLVVLKWIYEIN